MIWGAEKKSNPRRNPTITFFYSPPICSGEPHIGCWLTSSWWAVRRVSPGTDSSVLFHWRIWTRSPYGHGDSGWEWNNPNLPSRPRSSDSIIWDLQQASMHELSLWQTSDPKNLGGHFFIARTSMKKCPKCVNKSRTSLAGIASIRRERSQGQVRSITELKTRVQSNVLFTSATRTSLGILTSFFDLQRDSLRSHFRCWWPVQLLQSEGICGINQCVDIWSVGDSHTLEQKRPRVEIRNKEAPSLVFYRSSQIEPFRNHLRQTQAIHAQQLLCLLGALPNHRTKNRRCRTRRPIVPAIIEPWRSMIR